jgi:hypothetical protein
MPLTTAQKVEKFVEETECGYLELTVDEVRKYFDGEDRNEELDGALDNAQAQVFGGECDEAYILIKIGNGKGEAA